MTRNSKYLSVLLGSLLAAGCAGDNEDLRTWMVQEESMMSRSVPPIPEIKPHTIIGYEVADAVDPFDPVRVAPQGGEATETSGEGPDPDRQREPLEAFPLSSLAMVGMLRQDNMVRALVRAGNNLYQVSVGNYLGQDHGKVIEIGDTELTIQEWVEGSDGEWIKRTNTLLLQER